jgi:hypothetical protein
MKTWHYTKNVVMDNKTIEGREALDNTFLDLGSFQDWYFKQVEAGLADSTMIFVPQKLASDTVYEHLVTDQTQADSFIAMAYAQAERIGRPLSGIVVDVDYTTDTIPVDFVIRIR